MPWSDLPEVSTFERAKRREAYRRLARAVTGGEPQLLPQLDDVKDRLRLFDQRYIGVRPIEVARIVGTAGRNNAFDKDFLPRRHATRERWKRLEQAFDQGGFPPISVYQVGDDYYVIDGHHRVAIAKARKIDYIDAEVTELRPRRALPEGLDVGRVIFAEQERRFREESGLSESRPDVRIEFTKPVGYVELLELVQMYGFRLMLERQEAITRADAAAHFYDDVYLPAVRAIRAERLHEAFEGNTEADLYLFVHERRRALLSERGYLTMQDVARELSTSESRPHSVTRRAMRRLRGPEKPPA